MKRALLILVIVGALAAVAAPKVLPLLRAKPAAATASPGDVKGASGKAGGGGAPLRVNAVTLMPTQLAETLTSTGTLRAEEGVELQFETNGKIIAINFTEGAKVKKGDLMVKLNDAELRATLQRSAYRLELAEIKERRLAKLLETKSVNQQDYDIALSELSVQRAEVALVEAQIAKLEIRAPFDGVVGLRFVSEGAFVNATTRIATLQRLDHLKVDFSVPEKYAGRIQAGSLVTFLAAGFDKKSEGSIYAVEPRIDVTTRTVQIRAICPNPDGRLLPGAFANVEVVLAQVKDALLVPAVAVIPGVSEKNVFVVTDGKASRRTVETGTRTESMVQILTGLRAGDVVITSGLQQVRAGLAVQPVFAEGAKVPPPEAAKGGRGGKAREAEKKTGAPSQ